MTNVLNLQGKLGNNSNGHAQALLMICGMQKCAENLYHMFVKSTLKGITGASG